MKNRKRDNRNSGFTMVEILATVGIIVILLAIATVSVIRYIDVLKIAEMDNAAREIYMAAENRAVLLYDAQRLDSAVEDGRGQPTQLTGNGHVGADEADTLSLLSEGGSDSENKKENLYYVYSTSDEEKGQKINEELLTYGSIDRTLLDNGDFYIVYDLESGSVTDVFYAERSEETKTPLDDILREYDDFKAFYADWGTGRSGRLSLKNDTHNTNKTLVGWYNGLAAEGGKFEETIEVAPLIKVDIINREKLTVKVTVQGDYVDELKKGAKLEVLLLPETGGSEGVLLAESEVTGNIEVYFGGKGDSDDINKDGYDDTIVYTWILDSLTPGSVSDENGNEVYKEFQFKNIVTKTKEIEGETKEYYIVTPGDNFMVRATITKTVLFTEETLVSAEDTDNSLFWYDKTGAEVTDNNSGDGNIAYIKYLRHLQNLSAGDGYDSGVTQRITAAQQVGDILGDNNETYPNYHFMPIVNERLASYTVKEKNEGKGDYFAIRNLTLKADSGASVGLFETTTGTMSLTHIRMVNTKVSDRTTVTAAFVGALVGQAEGSTTINDCWVYWETDRYIHNLKTTLGTNAEGDDYKYQLKGQTVGGLVGVANGTTMIKNSLSATLIEGTLNAGGLVGEWNSDAAAISNSYADCYLTGGNSAQVAGLIGNVKTSVTLENCYTAGFILGGGKAAGLCLGSGATNAENVYTVMLYPDWEDEESRFFLTGRQETGDRLTNTYFLGAGSITTQDKTNNEITIEGRSYNAMTEQKVAEEDFAYTMGDNFAWELSGSHPYNLRINQGLTAYNYPRLKDTEKNFIPHYGDWGTMLMTPTLVYYEKYSDGSWGVSGGVRNLVDNGTKTIVEDGYAVAFMKDSSVANNATVEVKYTYYDDYKRVKTGEYKSGDSVGDLPKSEITDDADIPKDDDTPTPYDLYLVVLPDEIVNNVNAAEDFYHYLKFELKFSGSDGLTSPAEYFFNPHFAETVVAYPSAAGDENEGGTDEPSGVDVDDDEEVNAEIKATAGKLVKDLRAETLDEVESKNSVLIRTPRHLYHLSQHVEEYSQIYKFSQVFDLDYTEYEGFVGSADGGSIQAVRNSDDKVTPYQQTPIGSDAPFMGFYDGGYHTIRNIVPAQKATAQLTIGSDSGLYWGLFGYSSGWLQNIVYELDPEPIQMVISTMTEEAVNKYTGILAGGNEGTITNCVAWGSNVQVAGGLRNMYVGGLVGRNLGKIERCEAEFSELFVNYVNGVTGYTGGLVGINDSITIDNKTVTGTIETSYAVGYIYAKPDSSIDSVSRVCGFAGYNNGTISDSYSAVHLEVEGGVVTIYGFCGNANTRASLNNNYYLNTGNYTYRHVTFAADYRNGSFDDFNSGKQISSITYDDLRAYPEETTVPDEITNGDNPFSDHSFWTVAQRSIKPTDDVSGSYPYPTALTWKNEDDELVPIHYGSWPGKMHLGGMGVFYWEKLVITNEDGIVTSENYYIYALAVDPVKKEITRKSTLSTAHDDGGAVTEYGYGYYYDEMYENVVYDDDAVYDDDKEKEKDTIKSNGGESKYRGIKFDTDKIYYGTNQASNGIDFRKYSEEIYKASTDVTKKDKYWTFDGGCDDGSYFGQWINQYSGYQNISIKTCSEVKEALEAQMEGFVFWPWDSYHEGGRPAELWQVPEFRKAQTTPGIAPIATSWQENGKDVLRVNDEANQIGTFILTLPDDDETKDVNEETTVTFVVNPHFAASLSVKSVQSAMEYKYKTEPIKAMDPENVSRDITKLPGTEENPYQIRCGIQLQNIGTQSGNQNASALGVNQGTVDTFMYLTGDKKFDANNKHFGDDLYWMQTHDLDLMAEGLYYYTIKNGVAKDGSIYNDTQMGSGVHLTDFVAAPKKGYVPDTTYTGTGSLNGKKYVATADDFDVENDLEKHAGVFYSIAANRLTDTNITGSGLVGYFAGSYDGQSYTMKNLRICVITEQRYIRDVNCIGLFGATKGARLKNIVLYAENDNDPEAATLTVVGQEAHNVMSKEAGGNGYPGWYAGGVLAGVALDGDSNLGQHKGEITGCAVAGYTISDETQAAGTGDMGGAIGGLVGMTDLDMTGCTAVVKIQFKQTYMIYAWETVNGKQTQLRKTLPYTHSGTFSYYDTVNTPSKGAGTATLDTSTSLIRVGGLVGSTTGNVTNCYTGGSIVAVDDASNATVSAAQLIGGVGIEPLQAMPESGQTGSPAATASVSIQNSYSYLDLTKRYSEDDSFVASAYNIGRAKGGSYTVTLTNNYYLEGTSDAPKKIDAVGWGLDQDDSKLPVELTHDQLANKALIETSKYVEVEDEETGDTNIVEQEVEIDIYEALNGESGPYTPVTDEVGGVKAAGRFSYVPVSIGYLQGHDYPFPTVLTQERDDALNGIAHVHYGEWRPAGILRSGGSMPIYMDVYKAASEPNGKTANEELTLAEGIVHGGTWTIEWYIDGQPDNEGDPIIQVLVNETKIEWNPEKGTFYQEWPGEENLDEIVKLTINALKATDDPVTMKVTYTEPDQDDGTEGATYTLEITIYVTGDESTVIRYDPDPVKINALSDNLSCVVTLTLADGLEVEDNEGEWAFNWDNETNINVIFCNENGQTVTSTSPSGRKAYLNVTANKDSFSLSDLPLSATITVTFTKDEKTYTKEIPVTIEASPIKSSAGDDLGEIDVFGHNNIDKSVFTRTTTLTLDSSGIPGGIDSDGVWSVSWPKMDTDEDVVTAYFNNGEGVRTWTGGNSVDLSITVKEGDNKNPKTLPRSATVTVTYTTYQKDENGEIATDADGNKVIKEQYSKDITVTLIGNVKLAISGGGMVDGQNMYTVQKWPESMPLYAKHVGKNESPYGNSAPMLVGKLVVTRCNVIGGGSLSATFETETKIPNTVGLDGTWPNMDSVQLEVTYTAISNGYSLEDKEIFVIKSFEVDAFKSGTFTMKLNSNSGNWTVTGTSSFVEATVTNGTTLNLTVKNGNNAALDILEFVTVQNSTTGETMQLPIVITGNVRAPVAGGNYGVVISEINNDGTITFKSGGTLQLYPRGAKPDASWSDLYDKSKYWSIDGLNVVNGSVSAAIDGPLDVVSAVRGADNRCDITLKLVGDRSDLKPGTTLYLTVLYTITANGYSKECKEVIPIEVDSAGVTYASPDLDDEITAAQDDELETPDLPPELGNPGSEAPGLDDAEEPKEEDFVPEDVEDGESPDPDDPDGEDPEEKLMKAQVQVNLIKLFLNWITLLWYHL